MGSGLKLCLRPSIAKCLGHKLIQVWTHLRLSNAFRLRLFYKVLKEKKLKVIEMEGSVSIGESIIWPCYILSRLQAGKYLIL